MSRWILKNDTRNDGYVQANQLDLRTPLLKCLFVRSLSHGFGPLRLPLRLSQVRESDGVLLKVKSSVDVLEEAVKQKAKVSDLPIVVAVRTFLSPTHASPKIQALMPTSAPTIAPTQREDPDDTRPRLSDSPAIAQLSLPEDPNEKASDVVASQLRRRG